MNFTDASVYQLSLFDEDRENKRKIESVMDSINDKFGEASIIRASTFTDPDRQETEQRRLKALANE
ncbi:hypothetical protein [Paenibacillus alvei]|uniref:hypothetical protein n=1 Tax=Paenibacillus alvei TaxID=44250 RepID=UPI002280BB1D|nr:hypothetical protein [Paenibacillus alvei]MCY7488062.1 hypothetical protein [Paenibacillus alvei]